MSNTLQESDVNPVQSFPDSEMIGLCHCSFGQVLPLASDITENVCISTKNSQKTLKGVIIEHDYGVKLFFEPEVVVDITSFVEEVGNGVVISQTLFRLVCIIVVFPKEDMINH